MTKTLRTLTAGMFAMTLALAADNNNNTTSGSNAYQEMATRAIDIQKDAEWMSKHLKTRQIDRQQLEQHSAAVEENIAKLKGLVASVESNSGQAPAGETWQKVKTKVELLAIFHGKKKELLAQGDLSKNRGWLKAHADGIARRAEMLHQSASQLN